MKYGKTYISRFVSDARGSSLDIALNRSAEIRDFETRGPWVAHLRKRSKVTVEPFTEDH